MAKEIERKYLVLSQKYKNEATMAIAIAQGYISTAPERTVRVRLKGDKGYITVKGITRGCERNEWEYEIPVADAREMLSLMCEGEVLSKTRYIVPFADGLKWEIDEFHGSLQGLVLAEVELPSTDAVLHPLPDFIGREVTGDERYYNSVLAAGIMPPCE